MIARNSSPTAAGSSLLRVRPADEVGKEPLADLVEVGVVGCRLGEIDRQAELG